MARLRSDPRVRCREGVNARELTPEALGADLPAGGFDWVVIDVSFISITRLLASAARVAAPNAILMALVKPQFEVGQDGLDRRGLVRSPDLYPAMRESVQRCADAGGWQRLGWYDSALAGGDGNREFFMHARRGA